MSIETGKILSFDSLGIGYFSGKKRRVLLPPLKGTGLEGELIAVIGRNGVGKSTLLRTIAGLQPVLGGNIEIEGRNIIEYSRIQLSSRVGYISTEPVRVSNMKVYDLVSLGRYPHTDWFGKIEESDHKVILDALAKTGLSEFSRRNINEISDGERQRALIAMVLAQDADIMVMDEPTAFLDISNRIEIMHLLHRLTRERKKTIAFSTHDFSTAISQSDKIWMIRDDGLLEGAPEDIMLSGAFRSLFDETKVGYNPNDGSFTIRHQEKGPVSVRGEGELRYWTEKAVTRAGYYVDAGKGIFEIDAPLKPDQKWVCRKKNESREFGNIYDLMAWISNNDPIS
jgi:cobalamin transport system ATP-binding protein